MFMFLPRKLLNTINYKYHKFHKLKKDSNYILMIHINDDIGTMICLELWPYSVFYCANHSRLPKLYAFLVLVLNKLFLKSDEVLTTFCEF